MFFFLKTVNREHEINGRIRTPEQLAAVLFLFNHPMFCFLFFLRAKVLRATDDLYLPPDH